MFQAKTGLQPPQLLPGRRKIDEAWKSWLRPMKFHWVIDSQATAVFWPLCDWLRYLMSTPSLWNFLKWSKGRNNPYLSLLVQGDGFPIAGASWSQLNVSFLSHDERTRLTSHVWVVALAHKGDKDGQQLGRLWRDNIQVILLSRLAIERSTARSTGRLFCRRFR